MDTGQASSRKAMMEHQRRAKGAVQGTKRAARRLLELDLWVKAYPYATTGVSALLGGAVGSEVGRSVHSSHSGGSADRHRRSMNDGSNLGPRQRRRMEKGDPPENPSGSTLFALLAPISLHLAREAISVEAERLKKGSAPRAEQTNGAATTSQSEGS
ncbi:MAG: hypothetical protein KDD44_02025 [Bdellovibrionales bacterium]|nr:hypothetical protein [Bdellovibrionales bacterium]